MCPMRFWLLFFSGIVAGYLAWTSSFFSSDKAANRLVGDEQRGEGEEGECHGCEAGAAKAKKVRSRGDTLTPF